MTIVDIAKESGYSVSTVSRVLNGRRDVSPAARKKIMEIVDEHQFVPNNNAKHLKGSPYFQVRLPGWICLPQSTPTLFNAPFRRCAEVPLLRLHIAPCGSNGMLTVSAIALAVRLRLRTRLTPG